MRLLHSVTPTSRDRRERYFVSRSPTPDTEPFVDDVGFASDQPHESIREGLSGIQSAKVKRTAEENSASNYDGHVRFGSLADNYSVENACYFSDGLVSSIGNSTSIIRSPSCGACSAMRL